MNAQTTRQSTSKSVRAYARRARITLWIQLVVAAVVLGTSVWYTIRISDQQKKFNKNVEALQHVQNALNLISASQPRYDSAILELTIADELIVESGAKRNPRLLEILAGVQYKTNDLAGAISNMELVRSLLASTTVGDDEIKKEKLTSKILLATYYCADGQSNQASNVITKEFINSHREMLLGDEGFMQACTTIAKNITESEPMLTTAAVIEVDSPYKIRFVYFQIRNEFQRADTIQIAKSLCEEKKQYSVPGIELVGPPREYPKNAAVRYYYSQQKAEARNIAAMVSELMRSVGWPETMLAALPVVGLEGLPQNRGEIWLPDLSATQPASQPANAAADKQYGCYRDEDLNWMVKSLNSTNRAERLQGGQLVAYVVRNPGNSDKILNKLLDELTMPRLDELSPTGRFNVLYMLNLRPRWSGDLSDKLRGVLTEMDKRAKTQDIKIGQQTQDCIDSLADKLEGRASRDTCGQ